MAGHATESGEKSVLFVVPPAEGSRRISRRVSHRHPRVYICDECVEVCHSVLEKMRSESQETLWSATSKGEISPENRSELLSRLALIKREIEALEKLGK